MKASDIPDDQIQQVAANDKSIYYRVGNTITVISVMSSVGYRWLCLTCIVSDCAHVKAVRRYCGHDEVKAA